ncbi:MAG: helix-turn-helix domain-containing protein [Pyrinomonadaceae bacterium]
MTAKTQQAAWNLRLPDEHAEDVYDDGRLRVEHHNYYVSIEGRMLRLPLKEFLILSRLVRNPERVVRSTEIWQNAWGKATPFNAESLHVHVHRLRRRITPFRFNIEAMKGIGYRLTAHSV